MDVVSKEDAQDERIKSIIEVTGREGKIEESRLEVKATISTLEATDNASVAAENIAVPDNIATKQRDLRAQEQDLARLLQTYDGNAEAVVDLRGRSVNPVPISTLRPSNISKQCEPSSPHLITKLCQYNPSG